MSLEEDKLTFGLSSSGNIGIYLQNPEPGGPNRPLTDGLSESLQKLNMIVSFRFYNPLGQIETYWNPLGQNSS